MKRGYIKLWRKSKESSIFAHEGLWKLWCLCLMNANHEGAEVLIPGMLKPVRLKPGQFITGRYALHEDYHQAHIKKRYRRKALPAPNSVFRWLLTLQDMQMLCINSYSKFSIITILNWDQYQGGVHQRCISGASSVHKQELKEELKEETPDISSLKKRYTNQGLIDKVFSAIASTRKSGKVADSVLIAQMKKWERYSVEQVETGIRLYLEKDYAGQGKREPYLLGIIRNQNSTGNTPRQVSNMTPEQEMEELNRDA